MASSRSLRFGIAACVSLALGTLAVAPAFASSKSIRNALRAATKAHPLAHLPRLSSSHSHGRVYVGTGLHWYGGVWGYPRAYYYNVAAAEPVVFIEKGDQDPAYQQPAAFWYFCHDSAAYYPQVETCASPWEPVAPLPEAMR